MRTKLVCNRYFPDPPGNVTEQNGERKHGHCARIDSGGTPPRPVSAACPPNLFTIHSSLFTENARYRYRVVVDAQTKAPLAKGAIAKPGGFPSVAGFHMGLYFQEVPAVNPSVTATPCQLPLAREPLVFLSILEKLREKPRFWGSPAVCFLMGFIFPCQSVPGRWGCF